VSGSRRRAISIIARCTTLRHSRLSSRAAPAYPKTSPEIRGVSIVQFTQPFRGPGKVTRNTCIVSPGRSDRSPTGTGTSARLAVLYARGQIGLSEQLTHSSIIGSEFHGRILSETAVAGRPAILPAIRGRAWITGYHTYRIDPQDPYPQGYLVSDTWGVTGNISQSH
jgi:proline racemase